MYLEEFQNCTLISISAPGSCWVETWDGDLDDNTWQASINRNAVPNTLYQIDKFYNGIGSINGVSSARVVGSGCVVSFKNKYGTTMRILRSGAYPFQSFVHDNGCGNDVVTQYTIEIQSGMISVYTIRTLIESRASFS